MTRLSKKFVFAAAIAAGLSACAGDDPTVDVTAEEIIGGVPARSAKLDAVGALGFGWGDGGHAPFCTGTLIAPTVVLTAKHCVDWLWDPELVRFLVGHDALAPKAVVPVRGWAVEPTLEGGLIGLGADVAVLHLAEPVAGVTPLAYAAMTDDLLGRRLAGIGYGVQDLQGSNGTRRTGSMTLQQIGGRLFDAIYGGWDEFLAEGAPRFFPWLDPSDPAQLAELEQYYELLRLLDVEAWLGNGRHDAQACFGDSGGPITGQRGGRTTVFGVASWVAWADPLCELGTAYARLEPVTLDFLDYELHCPMIPREGACDGLTTVVRCATPEEGGRRELRIDCAELGLICGIDEAGELGCVEDPCEGLPPEGVCEDTVAIRCTHPGEGPRRVVSTDCAELGLTCGFEDGEVACLDDSEPSCDHDVCTEGTRLHPSCGPCEAAICELDPYCCQVEWDALCTGAVESVCGLSCEA